MIASSLVRAGDIVHVAFCTRMWMPDLTLAGTTNESCHLEQQPTRCDCRVENPEEQVHWLLTRRDSGRRVSPAAVSDPSRGARSGATRPAPL